MLFEAAEAERGRRSFSAMGSFVAAALCVGFAFWTGLDTGHFPTPDNVLLATSFGSLAAVEVIAGIGSLWWERGPAEIAWEQWHATHEPVTVQTSTVHFTPTFAPTRGGATGGVLLRF